MPRLPGFPTDCTITFDGDPIPARSGESVASALLAAGRPLLARSPKYHRPRGPFCLAGSCGSCLVRVDGAPDLRACATPCRDGLTVETQNAFPSVDHDLLGAIDLAYPRGLDHHHLMTWSGLANRAAVAISRKLAGLGRLPEPPRAAPPPPPAEERFDALVVGSGPAGLGAAEALARAGRRTLVAEAEPVPGGRLRARLGSPRDPDLAWVGEVAGRVRSAGGEVATGAPVIALWVDRGEPLAGIRTGRADAPLRLVRARRLVLCPGGHPQPPAFPGGDRPGVLSARGLAAALAEHGVLPGRRVVVLGAGAEAEALLSRLREAGAEAIAAPAAARATGRTRVRGLVLPDGRRVACDAVAIASRPAPATDLARLLGAAAHLDPALGAAAVRVTPSGATSVPGLLAAGETTGPMDAAAARDAGRRAGEEASRA